MEPAAATRLGGGAARARPGGQEGAASSAAMDSECSSQWFRDRSARGGLGLAGLLPLQNPGACISTPVAPTSASYEPGLSLDSGRADPREGWADLGSERAEPWAMGEQMLGKGGQSWAVGRQSRAVGGQSLGKGEQGGKEQRPAASPTQAPSSMVQPTWHWVQSLLVGPKHSLQDSSQAGRQRARQRVLA